MNLYGRLDEARRALARLSGAATHDIAVVLGSGFGSYPTRLVDPLAIPYRDIPTFPLPAATGHAGVAYSTAVGRSRVLVLAGRVHAYEGAPIEDVTFAVRTAIHAGCHTVLLTNAAGGCGDGIHVGDIVVIRDHLNLAGISPLAGGNDPRLGPRWPDMTDVYTPTLRSLTRRVAGGRGIAVRDGVYAWFMGPMFETPAEVEMARRMGADLVGMSTVPEATVARHMGARVLGLSLVTNLAAGISPDPITSEEVLATARAAEPEVGAILDGVLGAI